MRFGWCDRIRHGLQEVPRPEPRVERGSSRLQRQRSATAHPPIRESALRRNQYNVWRVDSDPTPQRIRFRILAIRDTGWWKMKFRDDPDLRVGIAMSRNCRRFCGRASNVCTSLRTTAVDTSSPSSPPTISTVGDDADAPDTTFASILAPLPDSPRRPTGPRRRVEQPASGRQECGVLSFEYLVFNAQYLPFGGHYTAPVEAQHR